MPARADAKSISESGNFSISSPAPALCPENDDMRTYLIDGQLYVTAAEYRAALKIGSTTM